MNVKEMLLSIFPKERENFIVYQIVKNFEKNVIHIRLDTGIRADDYDRILIKVVSKETLQENSFEVKFNDILNSSDRIDNRTDYKENFHIWMNNGDFDWYIAKPSQNGINKIQNECYKLINIYGY